MHSRTGMTIHTAKALAFQIGGVTRRLKCTKNSAFWQIWPVAGAPGDLLAGECPHLKQDWVFVYTALRLRLEGLNMAVTFKEVRKLQGNRVRMQFDDGREVVAMLLCATKDVDGSRHLIYDDVKASGSEAAASGAIRLFLCGCEFPLVAIESADGENVARTLHGWDYLDLRRCA